MNELFQSADWKKEKHVPVIEIRERANGEGPVSIGVTVGKEIPHPNTTEHHIDWIEVYFLPDGDKFPYFLGKADIGAHGASARGPNTSTVYTDPVMECVFRTEKSGTVIANSYCNIHGLWTASERLTL